VVVTAIATETGINLYRFTIKLHSSGVQFFCVLFFVSLLFN
jgi:hypothetical protein